MRLLPVLAALLAVFLSASSSIGPGVRGASASPITVRFLYDLGDGTYAWANETIPDPAATNATWDAAVAGAASAGLTVQWSWFACCGVFVTDLGDRSPPSGGVALFLWNATTSEWDSASVGISSLVLQEGDSVALSDNGFDPVTFATLYPIPTPLHPYPAEGFRGDIANTGASSSRAPDEFGVRWNRDLHLQEIPSTPAVAYGRVYVLTMDGLFALDETSGAVLWSNASIRGLSSPAVFNGTLLLGGSDGRLHSIDASDGTELWNVTLLAEPQFSGVTSSPKLLFDTAYIGTFNETGGAGEVLSLWATNGTIRWRQAAPGSISFSSPAVVDGALYVGVIGRYNTSTLVTYDPPYGVLALDATTGAQRWFHPTGASVAASPLVHGSQVLAPSKDGAVYALNTTTGAVVWQASVAAGVSSPALVGSTVVVAGGAFGTGGRVSALDAATGSALWTFVPNGPVQSSVSAADGKVFFSTNVANGTIYAVNASSGRPSWSYTPSPLQYIFGSPVVADGLVFAPSDNGHVYCFAAVSPALASVVTIYAPPGLAPGQAGNLSLRVSAPNGTWDVSRVTVEVTRGLDIVAASPTVPLGSRTLVVDLGRIDFGRSKWFNLTLRGNGTGRGYLNVTVHLAAGPSRVDYSPSSLAISLGSAAPAPVSWLLLTIVAVGAVLGVVVVVIWFDRRRRRGP